MSSETMRALVVDDEFTVRSLTVRSLRAAGFSCEESGDGAAAAARLQEERFDLLVTDLRMPVRNGYKLALTALEMEPRPFIVVLTGVADPRIAHDLLMRGIDDIVFKPVPYDGFATKVKALMMRRRERPESAQEAERQNTEKQRKITLVELGKKIGEVSQIFPISQAALDVFNLTASGHGDAGQVAELIECDPALAAQLLKVVNSAYYNPSGHAISSVRTAVIRLGQHQIGELALAHNALSVLSRSELSWLDTKLSWKRSLAAGVAMKRLIDDGNFHDIEGGLHNAAIMHPLGRIVLGTLFPQQYETMIAACQESAGCLRSEEQQIFPVPHGQVLTNVLQSWGVPTRATRPLTQMHASYEAIKALPEPERMRTQLLKASIYLARLAAGGWEPWDTIEIPPADVLQRLAVRDPDDLIKQIAEDTETLCKSGVGNAPMPKGALHCGRDGASGPLAFHSLLAEPYPAVRTLLSRMGRRIDALPTPDFLGERVLVLDCRGVAAADLPGWTKEVPPGQCVIVADKEHAAGFRDHEHLVALPASVRRLEQCLQAAGVQAAEVRQPERVPT